MHLLFYPQVDQTVKKYVILYISFNKTHNYRLGVYIIGSYCTSIFVLEECNQ